MSCDDLIAAFCLRFDSNLEIHATMSKDMIIDNFIARALSAAPAKTTHPQPNAKPKILQSTEYMVVQETLWYRGCNPARNNQPISSVTSANRSIKNAVPSTPPVTPLSGRWSSQQSPNFVLVFTGESAPADLMKFRTIFTDFFGRGSTNAPQEGYMCMMPDHVPIIREDDGSLPSEAHLLEEMCLQLQHVTGCCMLQLQACMPNR
jgi:hypothetical protein